MYNNFCRTCGTATNGSAVCTNCGCQTHDGNAHCNYCGNATLPQAIMCVRCHTHFNVVEEVFEDAKPEVNLIALAATALMFIAFFIPWISFGEFRLGDGYSGANFHKLLEFTEYRTSESVINFYNTVIWVCLFGGSLTLSILNLLRVKENKWTNFIRGACGFTPVLIFVYLLTKDTKSLQVITFGLYLTLIGAVYLVYQWINFLRTEQAVNKLAKTKDEPQFVPYASIKDTPQHNEFPVESYEEQKPSPIASRRLKQYIIASLIALIVLISGVFAYSYKKNQAERNSRINSDIYLFEQNSPITNFPDDTDPSTYNSNKDAIEKQKKEIQSYLENNDLSLAQKQRLTILLNRNDSAIRSCQENYEKAMQTFEANKSTLLQSINGVWEGAEPVSPNSAMLVYYLVRINGDRLQVKVSKSEETEYSPQESSYRIVADCNFKSLTTGNGKSGTIELRSENCDPNITLIIVYNGSQIREFIIKNFYTPDRQPYPRCELQRSVHPA